MEETLSHELPNNGAFGPEYEAEHWAIGLARRQPGFGPTHRSDEECGEP